MTDNSHQNDNFTIYATSLKMILRVAALSQSLWPLFHFCLILGANSGQIEKKVTFMVKTFRGRVMKVTLFFFNLTTLDL